MSLFPSIQGLCEVYPDRIEPEDIRAANRDGSLKIEWYSSLRAELKVGYLIERQATFGRDMKAYWTSDCAIVKVVHPQPVLRFHRWNLEPLCNKPTMSYWELSAQRRSHPYCPGLIFACIYKFGFRFHDNAPGIKFGRFFAHPFRMAATGPQMVPEILKMHAHLCDGAASHLEKVKSGDTGNCPIERSRWQHFHLLPICRAITVLLDKLVQPLIKMSDTISLNDEVRRQIAVLILTGYDQDLSSGIDFGTIRAESLPLARRDVSATDSANMIRVSLKTAVQLVAELQKREERAFSSSRQDPTETTLKSQTNAKSTVVNDADEYVENIFANPTESSSWSTIQSAFRIVKAKQRGEMNPEAIFSHWAPTWISRQRFHGFDAWGAAVVLGNPIYRPKPGFKVQSQLLVGRACANISTLSTHTPFSPSPRQPPASPPSTKETLVPLAAPPARKREHG